eukprot:12627294-Alexandrium_andersonii.AAC.1
MGTRSRCTRQSPSNTGRAAPSAVVFQRNVSWKSLSAAAGATLTNHCLIAAAGDFRMRRHSARV